MGFVEGETGYCSETGVMCDGDGTEEVSIEGEDTTYIKEEASIEVEEAINIKVEIPEFVSVQSIKTEHEVSLWGVCEVVAANAFRPFIAPQKGKCKIALGYFLFCVIMWVPYAFLNLDCNPEEKRLFGSHNH
jgi:hypothetical protein